MAFLRMTRFAKLRGYWGQPKLDKRLASFIKLTVVCSNYGLICKSEEFYGKGNWRNFERYLVKKGWRVVRSSFFCSSCYKRYLGD